MATKPKIVPLTHENICAQARNNQISLQLKTSDTCLNIMPLFHSTGLVGVVLSSLISGASVVCPPGFYAPLFFEWLEEFQPTWFTAVPSMHQAIVARARVEKRDEVASTLRFIRSSSTALSQQLMTELEQLFRVPIVDIAGGSPVAADCTRDGECVGRQDLGAACEVPRDGLGP